MHSIPRDWVADWDSRIYRLAAIVHVARASPLNYGPLGGQYLLVRSFPWEVLTVRFLAPKEVRVDEENQAPRMRGAGGTPGGIGGFAIGLGLLGAGLYLVFSRVVVHGGHFFGGYMGGFFGQGGAIAVMIVPFVLGVGWLFYDAKAKGGWATLTVAMVFLIGNILTSLDIYFQPTSLPTFLGMFVMIAAGLGLIVRSFRDLN